MTEVIKYTSINHEARIELDLSFNEYAVADSIYQLSANPNAPIQGWCYAKKEYFTSFLGISRQHIHKIINRLIKKGLVHRDVETKFLRTSDTWYQKVIVSNKKLHDVTKGYTEVSKKVTPDSKKRLHNNIIDNIKDNNLVTNVTKDTPEKKDERNLDISEGITLLRDEFDGVIAKERSNRIALRNLYRARGGKEAVLKVMKFALSVRGDQFAPQISNYMDLWEKWEALKAYYIRRQKDSQRGGSVDATHL